MGSRIDGSVQSTDRRSIERKPWSTPRVIVSEMNSVEGGVLPAPEPNNPVNFSVVS